MKGIYKPKLRKRNPFIIAYRVQINSREDDYLWGYYCGSRHSLLKGFRSHDVHTQVGSQEVMDYWFPVWWEDDIDAGQAAL